MSSKLRVGVAGPVGSGKTALVETLCLSLKKNYEIAVVTNDIYTKEDANFLINKKILEQGRIIGVETGGCPHTAIREDCSLNKNAVIDLENKFNPLDFIFVESGGDNLAASFSPELVDLSIYVIDVSAGDKIPRKGGPGITRSDLLLINKIDLADMVENFFYAWSANQLNAALRIIPIGSTKAQLIQRDLLEIISKVSKEIMDKEIDDIYFGNVGLAMAQQNHNDLYTKLFRN